MLLSAQRAGHGRCDGLAGQFPANAPGDHREHRHAVDRRSSDPPADPDAATVIAVCMNHDGSRKVCRRLLDLLSRRDQSESLVSARRQRADSAKVEVALPGGNREVEFMADRAVAVERYQPVAAVADLPDLLKEHFTGLEDS